MKKLLCVLLVLMLSLGLASAAFAEKIVVIGQQLGNVVFLPAEEGMKAAGKGPGHRDRMAVPPARGGRIAE